MDNKIRPFYPYCNHIGMVFYNSDTNEWYCNRCGDILDNPPEDWSNEDIENAKNNK